MNNWVDFKVVKQAVSLEAALARYGVTLRRVNRTYLRGHCPLPTHSSVKSSESFGVNTAKNAWACQSESCAKAHRGRNGGNLLDFVSVIESCSVRDAALKYRNGLGWRRRTRRRSRGLVREKPRKNWLQKKPKRLRLKPARGNRMAAPVVPTIGRSASYSRA